jgi:hypothetical protein
LYARKFVSDSPVILGVGICFTAEKEIKKQLRPSACPLIIANQFLHTWSTEVALSNFSVFLQRSTAWEY